MINPRPGRSLRLQTYEGDDVANAIDVEVSPGMIAMARSQYRGLLTQVGVWQIGGPTGRYNCHGLVFASRRTNIPPAADESRGLIDRLLMRDHFTQVTESDAHEGDIVVWRQDGEAEHTGFVSHVEKVPPRTIFIWSMWGGLGEFIHRVTATPYSDSAIEYWRLA